MDKGKLIPVHVVKAFKRREGRTPPILNLGNRRYFFKSNDESERE
jgi:hypothetical protein